MLWKKLFSWGEIFMQLKQHYEYVFLNSFVVMPNQIHVIMEIDDRNVGSIPDLCQQPQKKRNKNQIAGKKSNHLFQILLIPPTTFKTV